LFEQPGDIEILKVTGSREIKIKKAKKVTLNEKRSKI